ncbi:Rho guanine nucleotide exchange factor [Marasmius sp. AFHP31]|nr:Rho guanine nucleotide exchange factor [Marasmius sp. AFHP31]
MPDKAWNVLREPLKEDPHRRRTLDAQSKLREGSKPQQWLWGNDYQQFGNMEGSFAIALPTTHEEQQWNIVKDERAGRGYLAPTTRSPIRYLEGPTGYLKPSFSFANPRPSSGKPLSPEKLRREESAFRQLLDDSEQYEDILAADGEDAQEVLNDWQRLTECTSDAELRPKIARMIIKLSDNSGLFPQCLWIEEVNGLSKSPAEFGGSTDTWTGSINGVRVAIKVVRHRIDSQKREQVVKAFTREAMVWRNLNHPNILPFTGMYWFNGYQELVCLVSPQMENGNLLQFLNDHPELDPTTQLRLAKDVAQGLAYLHDLKIIHGDLKSYNVLITPDGTACISDLGLSRAVDADEATGLSTALSCWRPVRWLAPERLTSGGRSNTSPEGDIYAFGCVCYEIYARNIPFQDVEEYRIHYIVAVQGQRLEPPCQAPHAMQRLMESCWSAEPASRPKAMDIVDEIDHIQAGRPGVITLSEPPRPADLRGLFGVFYYWLLGWLEWLF